MLHSKTLEELKCFPIIIKLSLTKNMQNFIVKTFHQRNAKPSENNNSPHCAVWLCCLHDYICKCFIISN